MIDTLERPSLAQPTAPDVPKICALCFAPFRTSPTSGGASGYATTVDGERICYPCADKAVAADLANPAITLYTVYVNSDGKHVTSWTGGILGEVTWSKNGRVDRSRWVSPCLISYNVRTPDGRLWCGRGAGPGMYLNLRVMKGR